MSQAHDPNQPSAEAVAAFLRANPSWLADNPDLYLLLTPPVRVHGESIADHMAAMVRAARAQAAERSAETNGVVAAGRAAAGLAARVHEAVLALMRAPDPADCVATELPGLLAVDAASLCAEVAAETPPLRWAFQARLRPLPRGTVAALLGGRAAVFRDRPADAALLHAEAAPLALHEALIRVQIAGAPALLALASRDGAALPAYGAGALAFLGRAVAAALERADPEQ
jgi:uncharacterized protein YigA (DUF484 family)